MEKSRDSVYIFGSVLINENGTIEDYDEAVARLLEKSNDSRFKRFPACFGMLDDKDRQILDEDWKKLKTQELCQGQLKKSAEKWYLKYRMFPSSGSTNSTLLIVEFPNLIIDPKNEYVSQLEEKVQLLTHYTHIISHDLKNPIRNLAILMRFLEEGTIGQDECNDLIRKGLAGIKLTLENLNWSLKKDNLKDLPFEPIKFDRVIRTITDQYTANIRELGVKIACNLEVDQIVYNKAFLMSILSNLINNSIKYRSKERPLEIEITTKQQHNDVFLSVKDNGMGLSAAQINTIFDKFSQVSPRREGSGLGLYICKSIMPLFGDDIKAEGTINKGATFTLIFRNKIP